MMGITLFVLMALVATAVIVYPLLPGRRPLPQSTGIGDDDIAGQVRRLQEARSRGTAACPSCGAAYTAGDRFCVRCGALLPGAVRADLTCPSCGAAIRDGDRFCARCGQVIGGTGDVELAEGSEQVGSQAARGGR